MENRRAFVDLAFDPLDFDAATARIAARPADAPFAYVVTPNVDHVVRLSAAGDGLIKIYRNAWLCLCDSRILARIARLYGVTLPVVPGSDLTPHLLRAVICPGDRIAIVGGNGDTVGQLAALFRGVDFIQHVPPMGFVRDEAALAAAASFVAGAGARFTFLAVGSPQQEVLAARIAERGDAIGIGLCIGASIDFILGRQQRAPAWMQRAHLEWAHRLLTQPRRMWRRYLVEGPRIILIARAWARRR